MFKSKNYKVFLIMLFCGILITTANIRTDAVTEASSTQTAAVQNVNQTVKPLDIVNSPKVYLNKSINMNAKFDKFSTLGLDYKPAYRSSDNYISFLIKRDDTNFDIPLSEMKLFLKREAAEKFIDLKTDDEIKISGKVFSDALGDVWVDVDSITVIKKAPDKDGVK